MRRNAILIMMNWSDVYSNVEYTPKTLEEVYDILEEMVIERDI